MRTHLNYCINVSYSLKFLVCCLYFLMCSCTLDYRNENRNNITCSTKVTKESKRTEMLNHVHNQQFLSTQITKKQHSYPRIIMEHQSHMCYNICPTTTLSVIFYMNEIFLQKLKLLFAFANHLLCNVLDVTWLSVS